MFAEGCISRRETETSLAVLSRRRLRALRVASSELVYTVDVEVIVSGSV